MWDGLEDATEGEEDEEEGEAEGLRNVGPA
jgi:hypothetical protein